MVADVPVGVLLSGGIDSSLVVALLAEAGQTGLKTFSIGFESAGGESGDEFEYSDLVAQHFGTDHHQIKIDSSTAAARHRRRHRGDERADGQPRLRRVLPAQPGGRASRSRSSSPGQGADEVLGGYDWYPPLVGVAARRRRRGLRAGLLRPAAGRRCPACCSPEWLIDDDAPREFIAEHFGRPGAETALDAALRNDTDDHARRRPGQAGRQHDDGVGAGGAGCRSSTTSSSSSPAASRRS